MAARPAAACARAVSAKKDLEPNKLHEPLGLGAPQRGRGGQQQPAADGRSATTRFLLPVAEAEFAISNVLSELRMDPWPAEAGQRPQRCTGVAVSAAVSLLETNFANTGARVMLFTAGPCTVGPGQMVSRDKEEAMRSHSDLEKESANTKYSKKAQKHYAAVAKRAVAAGHVVDIFACALDQVGLMEMRPLLERTGGYTVMSESFTGNIFKQSFKAVFARDSSGQYLRMAFGGALEVLRAALPPGAEESRQTVKARAEARVKYGTERGGAPAAAPPVLKMHSAYGDTDTDTMSVSGSERSHGSAGRDRADSRNYWEGETAEASPAYPRRTRKPSYSVPPTTLAPGSVWKPAPPPPPTGSPPGRASVTAPPPPARTYDDDGESGGDSSSDGGGRDRRPSIDSQLRRASLLRPAPVMVPQSSSRASFPEPPAQAARGGAAAPRASPAAGRTGDFPPPPARAGSSGAEMAGSVATPLVAAADDPMAAWKARVKAKREAAGGGAAAPRPAPAPAPAPAAEPEDPMAKWKAKAAAKRAAAGGAAATPPAPAPAPERRKSESAFIARHTVVRQERPPPLMASVENGLPQPKVRSIFFYNSQPKERGRGCERRREHPRGQFNATRSI